ncbi:MAG: LCP family protein [Candidatus Peribacteria bacterium]|nr:LCP family protein [Candidatus Peribacteria bacterium]
MVASRNPEQGNISMFSIPRDLYVKSPITQGYGRINTIFTQFMGRNKKDIHASASGTVAEIATMLGMDIPYYATIDFTAFEGIIDAIGGIDIVIPETLHDTAYPNKENRGYITFHIDAGLQHLDGATALKYARSRYSTSDFSRSLRQQLIIMGIKDKLFGSGISLSVAQELYEQYKTYITTNVSLPEMLRTVQYLNTLKDFTSFGFTTNCSFQNYLKMPAACFLYYPDREAFGGASVMLPMGASVNVIQHYQQMQTFTHFILSNPTFIKQKATIEILNGIDKSLAR